MKHQTLVHSSVLAAVIITAIIGVGMVTGFSGEKPFISVDPVSDKNAGESFTVTGTTNLPAGTELLVQVYATSFEKRESDTGEFSGAVGSVDVVAGTGGINTWSMDLDTSTFIPMEYLVNASVFVSADGPGGIRTREPSGRTTFTILPGTGTAPASPDSGKSIAGGILIDPIRNTEKGELLEVTGKTNLSAGTPLLVKVIPASFDNEKILGDYRNPENAAVIRVAEGDGPNKEFSAGLDTRLLPVSDHIIFVSDMKDPAAGISSEPASWTGSAVFNIIAGTPGAGPSEPAVFINPVDDVTAGDPLTITGTTNVPAGAAFRVFMLPADSTDFSVPDSAVTVSALKGSGEANLVSATLATTGLTPGQHIAFVSAEEHQVTGTILFTVK